MEVRTQNISVLYRVLKTIFLILTWICIGLYMEITGPTLQDLKLRANTNYENIARAISGRSVGFFIGSFMGGFLVDKLTRYCDGMIGICLTLAGVTTVIVPWCNSLGLVWFIFVFQGTCEGVINIAGQRLIILLWMEKSASPLHALHMGFGIGSFIVPLISNPFMADRIPVTTPNVTNFSVTDNFNMTIDIISPHKEQYILVNSRIEYAYAIAGSITFLVSPVFYYYQFCDKKSRRLYSSNNTDNKPFESRTIKDIINPATCADGKCWLGTQIFIFLAIHFFNVLGIERICGKFVRAYAIDQVGFSKDDGTYINTAFWAAHALGRFSGFLAAKWIPIRIFILIELFGALLVGILLNIFAYDNKLMLWIFAPSLGFFIAPLFPSGIGWGNYHIEMTGCAITFLLCGASVGGVAYLWILGYFYDTYGPRSFLYQLLSGVIILSINGVLLTAIIKKKSSRFNAKTNRHSNLKSILEDTTTKTPIFEPKTAECMELDDNDTLKLN